MQRPSHIPGTTPRFCRQEGAWFFDQSVNRLCSSTFPWHFAPGLPLLTTPSRMSLFEIAANGCFLGSFKLVLETWLLLCSCGLGATMADTFPTSYIFDPLLGALRICVLHWAFLSIFYSRRKRTERESSKSFHKLISFCKYIIKFLKLVDVKTFPKHSKLVLGQDFIFFG